jgi:hypothetical protein
LSRSPEQRSNENQSIVQKFPFNSDLNAGGCFARWWDQRWQNHFKCQTFSQWFSRSVKVTIEIGRNSKKHQLQPVQMPHHLQVLLQP